MDVRNCRKCGKLFNYVMGPITCPQCKEALEGKFQEVKKYIQDHPGCGVAEVSDACDVSTQQIKQWLRDERLEFAEGTPVGLQCENCGINIRCGRFCDRCKATMAHNLSSVYQPEKKFEPEKKKDVRDNARMRYLDH